MTSAVIDAGHKHIVAICGALVHLAFLTGPLAGHFNTWPPQHRNRHAFLCSRRLRSRYGIKNDERGRSLGPPHRTPADIIAAQVAVADEVADWMRGTGPMPAFKDQRHPKWND